MRSIMLLFTLLIFSIAHAEIKTAQDFYQESEALYQKALKEKTFSKKASLVKNLKKSFEATLDEYEKKNPKEGGEAERDVSRLYYTFEPVFELSSLKKLKETDCFKQEQTVRSHDGMGKPEGTKTSARAQEALRWIEVLCK